MDEIEKNSENYGNYSNNYNKRNIYSDKFKKVICIVTLVLIILLEGLLVFKNKNEANSEYYYLFLYYMGCIFFLSGHFIAMNVKGFGILFLFSHSFSGIYVMLTAFMGNIFESPLMSDLQDSMVYYLLAMLSVFVTAAIYVIVYNLSDKVKKMKYSSYVPLVLYIIGFAMAGLFNVIMVH